MFPGLFPAYPLKNVTSASFTVCLGPPAMILCFASSLSSSSVGLTPALDASLYISAAVFSVGCRFFLFTVALLIPPCTGLKQEVKINWKKSGKFHEQIKTCHLCEIAKKSKSNWLCFTIRNTLLKKNTKKH